MDAAVLQRVASGGGAIMAPRKDKGGNIVRVPVPDTGPLVSTTYDGVKFTTPGNNAASHREQIRRYLIKTGQNRIYGRGAGA